MNAYCKMLIQDALIFYKQASEKALKAVLYSINADKVQNNVERHNLTQLASALSADMQTEVSSLDLRKEILWTLAFNALSVKGT